MDYSQVMRFAFFRGDADKLPKGTFSGVNLISPLLRVRLPEGVFNKFSPDPGGMVVVLLGCTTLLKLRRA